MNQVLTLKRVAHTRDGEGVCGVLIDEENHPLFLTLERNWEDNKPNESCIPLGEYTCNKRFAPHVNGELFHVDGVPNRTDVEIHAGNTILDIQGCILLGYQFGVVNDLQAVLNSKQALIQFMAMMKNDANFTLVIKEA